MDIIDQAKQSFKEFLLDKSNMSNDEVEILMNSIPFTHYSKGTIIELQGEPAKYSYFILKGCIRQYIVDEDGKEVTVDFYLEHESLSVYNYADQDKISGFYLTCLEDTVVTGCPDFQVADIGTIDGPLGHVVQEIFTSQIIGLHQDYAEFKLMTPEQRYLNLKANRPELLRRVPQVILASYLDITPESFSRYKKRFA